jgi:hypothetical protein
VLPEEGRGVSSRSAADHVGSSWFPPDQGLGFRAQGLGLGVYGLGFRV